MDEMEQYVYLNDVDNECYEHENIQNKNKTHINSFLGKGQRVNELAYSTVLLRPAAKMLIYRFFVTCGHTLG